MGIKYKITAYNGRTMILPARGETLAQKKSWARAWNKNSGVRKYNKIKKVEAIKTRTKRRNPGMRIMGFRMPRY